MRIQWDSAELPPLGSQSIGHNDDDNAEKGLCDASQSPPTIPPSAHISSEATSTVNETIDPPRTSIERPAKTVPIPNPEVTKSIRVIDKSVSRWVLFHLWFNTYRKLFLLCTSLNLTAMISAELGHFSYAIHNSGAMVLGNLLFAVLMRNELFLRLLYTMAIYGLRSVCQELLRDIKCMLMERPSGLL